MRMLAPDSEADVYAITCALGLTKIGVAADARERCRAMQVGSPVPLELAGSYHFRSSQDAYAIAADVQRQLADRQERGGWYRVTPAEVRHAIGNRSARQAPRAAAQARQAAPAAEAQAERLRAERVRQRRRGRAKARREKLRALARLLASGSTRRAAARELGLDERTIRRWTKLPGFDTELATARQRHERELERAKQREQKRRDHNARRRLARQHPARYRELYNPAMRPELRREPKPAAEPARGRLMRPIRLP
jgi:hypothetical protein